MIEHHNRTNKLKIFAAKSILFYTDDYRLARLFGCD